MNKENFTIDKELENFIAVSSITILLLILIIT